MYLLAGHKLQEEPPVYYVCCSTCGVLTQCLAHSKHSTMWTESAPLGFSFEFLMHGVLGKTVELSWSSNIQITLKGPVLHLGKNGLVTHFSTLLPLSTLSLQGVQTQQMTAEVQISRRNKGTASQMTDRGRVQLLLVLARVSLCAGLLQPLGSCPGRSPVFQTQRGPGLRQR